MTLLERRGSLRGLKLAYVGDGNNVCHSLMIVGAKLGVAVSVACPAGYEPDPRILEGAVADARLAGVPPPEVVRDPMRAVKGADVVYTDVWTSMGQEAESEKRRKAFQGFMVSPAMMGAAGPEAAFMHCLPAHRGEEVAAEVIDGPQSVVFDEAENRLHVQKALMVSLMGGK
jgi:ornithine carbamoyltransferase